MNNYLFWPLFILKVFLNFIKLNNCNFFIKCFWIFYLLVIASIMFKKEQFLRNLGSCVIQIYKK